MEFKYLTKSKYPKSIFIVLLIILQLYSAISQDDNSNLRIQNRIKILETKYINSTDEKEKLAILFQICNNYKEIQTDKVILYGNEAYELSNKLNDIDGQIRALRIIEYNDYLIGNYSKSIEKLLEAYNLATKYNRQEEGIEIKIRIGDSYRALTNSQKSISTLKEAIEEAKKINDTKLLASGYNRLAATYFEYIQEGPENILDSTRYWAEKSLKLARSINDTSLIINNLNILGATLIDLQTDDIINAKSILKEALRLSKLTNNKETSTLVSYHLSKLFHLENNLDSAFYYAYYGYKIAKESNINNLLSLLSYSLSSYYEKEKKYDSSLKYYQEFHYYFELVNNNRTGYQIQSLIDDNTKKQENLKAAMESHSRRLQTIIYILCITLLGFVSIVLFFRHKRSEISRKLLQDQVNIIENQNKELESKNEIISFQNTKLKNLNKSKDQLFSIISHDLKNPIGNINSSLSDLLTNWVVIDENDKIEILCELENSNNNVLQLLYDLLDWAKSQQGMIVPHPSEQDINFIIKQNMEFVQKNAKNKEIQIISNLQDNAVGYFDSQMINTIIRNLLTNAIKFTNRDGQIIISSKNEKDKLIVFIEDTGIGISKENIEKILSPEYYITTPGTEGEKGTGFGIKLVNDFLNKNNGELFIESQLGIGTKFTFILPIQEINEI